MSSTYFIPTINLMGSGCVKELGNQAKALGGTRALIVTGRSGHGIELGEQMKGLLAEAGVEGVLFSKTEPNPTDNTVHAGVELYEQKKCDHIVAVGGGSPMDCAKGIGIVVKNGGSIRDYEGVDKSQKDMPSMIAVNTTAGTASEMTRFTIITDTSRHIKMAIVDWRITPKVSINDPDLMLSMPASLTAATGMDALTHAVEAYVSTAATSVTDSAAIKAIELVSKYLRRVVADGSDLEAREEMANAQFMAGMAFNNASLGYVHAMAHQLGGMYDLPHGVCNAVLLPHVQEFNLIAAPERFVDIAKAMGEKTHGLSLMEAAELALKAIRRLSADIGIPPGLKEMDVKESDVPTLAENASKDACGLTNPRRATVGQLAEIYRKAM